MKKGLTATQFTTHKINVEKRAKRVTVSSLGFTIVILFAPLWTLKQMVSVNAFFKLTISVKSRL